MSSVTVPSSPHPVNRCRRKFDKFTNPSPEEIPPLWAGYLTTESLAPAGLKPGIARARTRLLSGVPSWRLPAVLDSLVLEGATA